jgi:endonuclease/exonuclease/phosphatase family metal-dependent hydrolase
MTFVPAPVSCRSVTADAHTGGVRWIGPDDPRDRKKLDAWCATVGPMVVEGPAAAPAARISEELVVVSWNTHVGGGDVAALVQRLRRGDFTGGVPVADFVLLLQEVFRRGPAVPDARGVAVPAPILVRPPAGDRRDILDVARSLALHVAYAPAMRNGPGDEDRGNAILATLPLADLLVIELPFERQRRVAIAATVSAPTEAGPSWQVRVATAHFDTALALARGGPAAARRRQAQALIDALSSPPMPIVVAGDFNTWWGDDEPAVRDLRRAFPDAEATRPAITWGGVFRAMGALDHMFARINEGRLKVGRLPDRFGSDHYPLMMLIRLHSPKSS